MHFGRKIVSSHRLLIAAVLLTLFGAAAGARAQAFSSTVIPSPDPQGSGLFGGAVSLSADGQTALAGSLGQGRAYLFVHNGSGWSLDARLPAAGPSTADFGRAVALSADGAIAAVSSPAEAACFNGFVLVNCGAVYVYAREGGGWVQKAHLIPPDFFDFEFDFGRVLALSADGSTLLVTRPADDCVLQPCRGAVFVYERVGDTWGLIQTLTASNPSVEIFGIAVSLTPDGNTALIGASLTNCSAGNDCGEAYVFTRNGGSWSEEARLTAPDPGAGAFFGDSVGLAADGQTALIGAPRIDLHPGTGPGAVYAFARSGGSWIETQKITAGASGDGFGRFLDLASDGQSALVGAPVTDCAAGTECGAVYRLARKGGTWTLTQLLVDFPANALGGFAVALSEDGAIGLAGAPGTSCGALASCGSVYVFEGLLGALAIPTLSESGLILLALLLAAGGSVMLRRRPRPAR